MKRPDPRSFRFSRCVRGRDVAARAAAFTLLELLVVAALIGGMSFVLVSGLSAGGKAAALHSAQTTVANLITAARTKAPATNRKTRLLIHAGAARPELYLRQLVLQLARQPGPSPADWDTVQRVTLPLGTYIVPVSLSDIVANTAEWKRVSDPTANLTSDLFANQSLSYALEGDPSPQNWIGVAFTPNNTLAALVAGPPPKGSIVLSLGRPREIGSYEAGQPPVELIRPDNVRGLVLSAYGVPALLDERSAF